MTVRWTFRNILNTVFGATTYPGKVMHVEHIGPDHHDQIPPGEGCVECGWIQLPDPE